MIITQDWCLVMDEIRTDGSFLSASSAYGTLSLDTTSSSTRSVLSSETSILNIDHGCLVGIVVYKSNNVNLDDFLTYRIKIIYASFALHAYLFNFVLWITHYQLHARKLKGFDIATLELTFLSTYLIMTMLSLRSCPPSKFKCTVSVSYTFSIFLFLLQSNNFYVLIAVYLINGKHSLKIKLIVFSDQEHPLAG